MQEERGGKGEREGGVERFRENERKIVKDQDDWRGGKERQRERGNKMGE